MLSGRIGRISLKSMLGLSLIIVSPLGHTQLKGVDEPSLFDLAIKRAAEPADDNKRAIGGGNAFLKDNLWQAGILVAQLEDNARAQFCGGVVISPKWILTAAHCIDIKKDPSKYSVLVGTDALDKKCCRLPVLKYIVHPSYRRIKKHSMTVHDSDLALLKVDSSEYNLLGSVIGIRQGKADSIVGMDLRATGWGVTERRYSPTIKLVGISVPVVDRSVCNLKKSYDNEITDNMICAGLELGGVDTCKGDSGGPATVEENGVRTLVGVISWGHGCAKMYKYGVYTFIPQFSTWINDQIARN